MAWNDNLEGPALQIAASERSPIRVVAGPGTGKTFALVRRIARLLEIGIPPDQILLITFTRMAASDTEREIMALHAPGVDRVRKGTLHSLCFSILNQANILQITGRIPRPLMMFEERFMLEDLGLEQAEYHEDLNHRKRRLNAFEAAWARQQDQQPGWPPSDADRNFQAILNEWLRFHKAILVGELVPITLGYLRNNPGCFEREHYRHVLVDEYQDLNKAEQTLIDYLAGNGYLTIVGDEDQSIYEAFRHAHPEGISQFEIDHPNTYDIPLIECRRCPTGIVSMANHLIHTNIRRLRHQLLPRQGNPEGDIYVIQWPSMQEEAEGIAEFIARKKDSREFDPGKTLILCPWRQFGYMLRDALVKRGITAHSFFQEEVLDGNPKQLADSMAQQAFTLLSLLVNPNDLVALRCWLGFGSPNLRIKEYLSLKEYCAINGKSILVALRMLDTKEIWIPHMNGLIDRYHQLSMQLEILGGLPIGEIVNSIFPDNQGWAEPFRIFLGKNSEIVSLEEIHKLFRENIIQPELPTSVDYVRIMSLHKSKGLNADHVIITGCIEGIIPAAPKDDMSFEQKQRFMEEQRRLFYVAITRTRQSLVLSSVSSLPRVLAYKMRAKINGGDEQGIFTIASTFITDLGPECPHTIYGAELLEMI